MNTTPKLFSILSVATIGLIFSCQASYAAVFAGQVQFSFGNVQVTTEAGNTHSLKKGDAVNEGDAVSTAVSSSAQIKMKDGGFIAIRPDTKMKFDKFVFNGSQDGEERSFFSLFKGGFRAVTGLIGKDHKQNYKITTTTATIGIRGTDHETFFVPEGNALVPAGAYSKVNVGETTMTTKRGTINVLPNQMGYSSSMNEVPKVVPINTRLFTVAAAPTKTIKERKAEQAKQAGAPNQGDKQGTGQTSSQGAAQTTKQDTSEATGSAGGNVAANTSSSTNTSSNSNSGSGSGSESSPGSSDPAPIRSADTDSAVLSNNNVRTASPASMAAPMATSLEQVVPIKMDNSAHGYSLNTSTPQIMTTLTGEATIAAVETLIADGSSVADAVHTASSGSTTASVPSAAYAANHVVVESTSFITQGSTQGSVVAPADLVYVTGGSSSSGALSSYTEQNIGGGSSSTYVSTIIGGTASSSNAPSFASTGIQYGSWTGYTGLTFTSSYTLGGTKNGNQNTWMYAPQGYIDTGYLPTAGTTGLTGAMAIGTFTYQLDGYNAPRNQNTGVTGTLNRAFITANFSTMKVSASLELNVGTDFWGASLTNQAINSVVGGGVFNGSAMSGSTTNTMTVTHGVGSATTCTTCSGNLSGIFTGQNFAGAMLAYNLSDSAQGSTVVGDAALTRIGVVSNTTPVTNGTPVVPTAYIIDNGFGFITSTSVVISSGNVLTQYGNGSSANGNTVMVSSCSTCAATAAGQVATSGIYYGTWTSGAYTSTFTSTMSAGSTTPVYWITGPEAGPLYLPQALIGTASYRLDTGQVSNMSGVTGTVNASTALTVNFTNQTVGINLNATVAGHTWIATAAAGAPLVGNQGLGGAAFSASTGGTGNGGGNNNSGVLSVTVDGSPTTSNFGTNSTVNSQTNSTINGQLTGGGLTGAIINFTLYGGSDILTGVAAFSGAAQNVNTPYRTVLASTYDSATLVPTLGFWANNSSRVVQDVATGNLIQFDAQSVNGKSNSNNNNVTVTNTGSTLTDHGTDPVTGISWGRWSGGTLNVANRATPLVTSTSTALTGSLHWIAEPVATTAVTLPISGTYAYTLAGGTHPTDNLGNVGTLNSATVSANFTAQTVNVGVNTTVAGTTLNATGTNAPIIQNTAFYASSQEPPTSSSYLTVKCTGTCGTTGGTVIGKFTGAGATGVAMSYGLQNGASVVSGVAAFHR